MIKKNPTTSIRENANELTVLKKTVRTAIKQDLKLKSVAIFWERRWKKKSARGSKDIKKFGQEMLSLRWFSNLWSPSSLNYARIHTHTYIYIIV